jgi:hypothetical protein
MEDAWKFFMILMFAFLFLFVIVGTVETPESSPATCEQVVSCPEGCQPVNQSYSETSFDTFMEGLLIILYAMLFSVIFMIILDL